jgi:GNAT superfamily N-acetyltransferase
LIVTAPQNPAEFSQYYELRWRVLREPWHQPRGSERDEQDARATHRMIVDQQHRILAVGRLHQTGPGIGQIRYMAVEPAHQGQGLGGMMLQALEQDALRQGLPGLFLHAREPVIGFYRRHGYQLGEPTHTLFGAIPHYYMHRQLGDD